MGSDLDESFAPKSLHGYVWAEVLYSDFWAYLCQVCLSMLFVMEMDGFGQ